MTPDEKYKTFVEESNRQREREYKRAALVASVQLLDKINYIDHHAAIGILLQEVDVLEEDLKAGKEFLANLIGISADKITVTGRVVA